MKGVYVIHDQTTGARYVGSAHGDTGIRQRWSTYAATLHGNNVGLQDLLDEKGEEHFARTCSSRCWSSGRSAPTTRTSWTASRTGGKSSTPARSATTS